MRFSSNAKSEPIAQPGLDALSKSFELAVSEAHWGAEWEQRGYVKAGFRGTQDCDWFGEPCRQTGKDPNSVSPECGRTKYSATHILALRTSSCRTTFSDPGGAAVIKRQTI